MSHIRSLTWYDQPAWGLESIDASVVMVPGMGAKIVSLLDKRTGHEWLAGPMAGRTVKPVASGAPFEKQDMAGWDEMFPTISACAYPGLGPLAGTPLPDHGEAWALPWTVEKADDDELTLALTGRALPYRLARSARFASPDVLALHYTLENLGDQPMPYLWAAHPQFLAGPGYEIILPEEVTEVVNTVAGSWGWGPPETRYAWPEARLPDGRRVPLDRVGAASVHKARKFFALPDARPSWASVLHCESGHRLRLSWDPHQVPYLGLWVDEGAVHDQVIIAPEPGTGWYDSLALAWEKGEVAIAPPHGVREWTLTVELAVEDQPCM